MNKNNIRIALVIQDFFRHGAEYVTSLVAEGLSKRGYKIDLVLSGVHRKIAQERPDLSPFPIPESVRVIELPHLKASHNIFALAKYFRQDKPCVVFPQSGHYTQASLLAAYLTRQKILILPVVHSSGISAKANKVGIFSTKDMFKGGNGSFFLKWCFSQVDLLLTVSLGTAEEVKEVYGLPQKKLRVVYNPVVNEKFYVKKKCEPDHQWLLKKEIPVIVAAGAHVKFKGYDVLIKAFAEVLRHQSCRLIIYGEGPEHQLLVHLATELGLNENISFPGYTQNLPANIAKASVFVVSSHVESFSVVLVEALACGTPVVATNCQSGPPEILADGKYGILVKPNDPHDLARGILQVLDGKGITPPVESWKPFCLDAVIDRYEAVIKDLLGGSIA